MGLEEGVYVQPNPEKISALSNVQPPQSKTEVRSFLGLIPLLSPGALNLSLLLNHMRALKHQHTHFKWTLECYEEFQMMKEVVGSFQFLQPFDIRKELKIFTDASKQGGLRFVLCQPGQCRAKAVIQCRSTSLKPAQTNYRVTEIDLLAI